MLSENIITPFIRQKSLLLLVNSNQVIYDLQPVLDVTFPFNTGTAFEPEIKLCTSFFKDIVQE